VRAKHDQTRLALRGGLDNPLPGGCGFNRQALSAEPFLLCERCSVVGSLFRVPPYFRRFVGVEVPLIDRLESNISRLPNAQNESISPGRNLTCGLLDRESGKLRTVVSKRGPDR